MFHAFRVFGVPVRMTVMRLPGTDHLVVYSPFDPSVVGRPVDLTPYGRVTAIIAPNLLHSLYAQRFLAAHHGATLYSSAALRDKYPERDWGVLLDADSPQDIISPDVLVQPVMALSGLSEVLVHHAWSGSVLAADLAFNLTPALLAKATVGCRLFYHLALTPNPLDVHFGVRYILRDNDFRTGKLQLATIVDGWEWDRFIPCHGEVFSEGAKEAFRKGTYRFVADAANGKTESSSTRMCVTAVVGVIGAVGAAVLIQQSGRKIV